jgi:periplasmic protein TonB
MFESINPPHIARHKQIVTAIGSTLAHLIVVGLALAVPVLYLTEPLPQPPDMLAFVVASAPPPPPPPPPPPAPPEAKPSKPKVAAKADPVKVAVAAPVEAPSSLQPEQPLDVPELDVAAGGVEGGVAGGIVGGIAGGIPMMPAPPPPPPPPAPVRPVRVGGDIEPPTLLHRVNPNYPQIAISAKKEGIVILEATVDTDGAVSQVRVLRSEPLLDKAAVDAVKQWRYAPLRLNGLASPFILTVTVSFNL